MMYSCSGAFNKYFLSFLVILISTNCLSKFYSELYDISFCQPKERILIISFQPISDWLAPKFSHEHGMQLVSVDVIGTFWRARGREFVKDCLNRETTIFHGE